MNTKSFNFVDKIIAGLRLVQIIDQVNDGGEILDFGCGVNSFLLNAVSKKIKLGVGLDYETRDRKIKNIEYMNYRFDGRLPFKNESFDGIFLLAVLEHIKINEVDKLFFEFKRVLKNDGKIVLTTPTPRSKGLLEFLSYKLRLISAEEIADHRKYYDNKEIIKLGKQNGLKLFSYDLFQFGLNSRVVFKKNN